MITIEKHSVSQSGGFIPQAVWLIGTRNEDGGENLGTVTSLSYLSGPPEGVVICVTAKRTKANILRTGEFTANLCSADMVRLADCAGAVSGNVKGDMPFSFAWGEAVRAPVLRASPYVLECGVTGSHSVGETTIFIAETLNQQIDRRLGCPEDESPEAYSRWLNQSDIHKVDPLLYTWRYYQVGEKIGNLGEFVPQGE